MKNFAYIVDAVRSPMGVKKGQLIGIRADELAAQTVKALLDRNPSFPLTEIEDVVLGTAFPEATQGMLMARGVALLAGIPAESRSQSGQSILRFIDGCRAPDFAGDRMRRL
jgi:acetyl-CoA acetyltransferase